VESFELEEEEDDDSEEDGYEQKEEGFEEEEEEEEETEQMGGRTTVRILPVEKNGPSLSDHYWGLPRNFEGRRTTFGEHHENCSRKTEHYSVFLYRNALFSLRCKGGRPRALSERAVFEPIFTTDQFFLPVGFGGIRRPTARIRRTTTQTMMRRRRRRSQRRRSRKWKRSTTNAIGRNKQEKEQEEEEEDDEQEKEQEEEEEEEETHLDLQAAEEHNRHRWQPLCLRG